MLSLRLLRLLAFSAVTIAQTPDGFEPTAQIPLSVVYPQNITVSPPGVLLQRAETQVQPTVSAPAGTPTDGTYIAVMIDLDVPRNGGTTLLHWLESDFTLTPNLVLTPGPVNSSIGASYIGPNPPPGSPHRYTFLLFSQPPEFTIPESFSTINPPTETAARIGFNITEFVAAAGLDVPLAGNYFTVVNTSATASATSTGSAAQSSVIQFEGGSAMLRSSIGLELGLGLFLAGVVAVGFLAV